ncbi:MAG: pyruvate synthase subunit beta [Acidobacteria bacterium]|nr:pyruvate synthase subunit beta [Acidobacteriota bacterium]MBI3654919.1 pyruvate synthase subunit beta [Acidobacteriota bacterium]
MALTTFTPKPNFDLLKVEDVSSPGHLACPGCGIMPAYRTALQVLGKNTIIVAPACCFAVVDGPFPYSAAGVPFMHCAFETAAASAAGVRAALEVLGRDDTNVVAWAGDGGTFDIGLQALSASAERNEDMIYVCYDNEAYMNTGIQRSSATPRMAWTTTTPQQAPKIEYKKDLGGIMAAHRIPYFATASLAHPEDMMAKFRKAKELRGFRMIHYFCPCPTGWKTDARYMVKLDRLAVQTKVFPLYEVFGGRRYVLNVASEGLPVSEYLKIQGRFSHLQPEDIKLIQQEVNDNYEELLAKVDHSNRQRSNDT